MLFRSGLAERIPVKVLSEKIRDQMAGSGGFDPEFEGAEMDLSPDQKNRKKKNIRIAIEISRLLPPGKRLQLVWGRGVSSPRGITNSKDQILAFRTEERFEARFYCQRERKEAPCLPISDMSLGFSAPIPWKIAEKVVLKLGNTVFHPANGNSSTEEIGRAHV